MIMLQSEVVSTEIHPKTPSDKVIKTLGNEMVGILQWEIMYSLMVMISTHMIWDLVLMVFQILFINNNTSKVYFEI